MAEFDVRLTSDNVAVLFHDEKFQDRYLSETMFDDFKKLIASEFTDLSKLEEVFEWMISEKKRNKNFDFKLNIEIKSKKIKDERLEIEVFRLIKKFKLGDQILISSFNPFTLYRSRKFDPNIWRALLVTHGEESNFLLKSMLLNFLAKPHVLHLRWNDFNLKLKNRFSKNVPVVLWTVNELIDLKNLKGKIHGVISDKITPKEFETCDTAREE